MSSPSIPLETILGFFFVFPHFIIVMEDGAIGILVHILQCGVFWGCALLVLVLHASEFYDRAVSSLAFSSPAFSSPVTSPLIAQRVIGSVLERWYYHSNPLYDAFRSHMKSTNIIVKLCIILACSVNQIC